VAKLHSMRADTPALGRLIGSGSEAEVFEHGALVVKLYRPAVPKRSAFREAAILAMVEALGLPVPGARGVQCFGGRWGIVMDRVNGPSFANAMRGEPGRVGEFLDAMARLQSAVHARPATQFASLKTRLAANIREARGLGEARRHALLDRLATLPEGDRLCHGDFHPMNILGPPGGAALVDWLDASRGDPAADVCRSFLLMRSVAPDLADAYVNAYARIAGIDRGAIFAWLPCVAAGRLAEAVPNEVSSLLELLR
jgi:aminoglycoside phosphotransferase (APT) family kinase protein